MAELKCLLSAFDQYDGTNSKSVPVPNPACNEASAVGQSNVRRAS